MEIILDSKIFKNQNSSGCQPTARTGVMLKPDKMQRFYEIVCQYSSMHNTHASIIRSNANGDFVNFTNQELTGDPQNTFTRP